MNPPEPTASSFLSGQAPPEVQLLFYAAMSAGSLTFGMTGAMTERSWFYGISFGLTTSFFAFFLAQFSLWELWLFWIPKQVERLGWVLAKFAASVLLLTCVFGVATALLRTPYDTVFANNLREVGRADLHYVWHFLDAIPLLKIPQTLNWRDPLTLESHAAGAGLLAYQLLIVLPVVTTVTALIKRSSDPQSRK
jgi:hypothetical protein